MFVFWGVLNSNRVGRVLKVRTSDFFYGQPIADDDDIGSFLGWFDLSQERVGRQVSTARATFSKIVMRRRMIRMMMMTILVCNILLQELAIGSSDSEQNFKKGLFTSQNGKMYLSKLQKVFVHIQKP